MSDPAELTLWQLAQGAGLTAIAGFAAEALRRAFRLGGQVALIEKAQLDQIAINAKTEAALEASTRNHYELKTVLAGLPTREEMRRMLNDFKDDSTSPRARRRPPA